MRKSAVKGTATVGREIASAVAGLGAAGGLAKERKHLGLRNGELECCKFFFFSSRRRHTRLQGDWSSDVCSSDLIPPPARTTLKTFGQWSRPAVGLIFGVRPNSLEIMTSVLSSSPRWLRSVMRVAKIGRASCRERV